MLCVPGAVFGAISSTGSGAVSGAVSDLLECGPRIDRSQAAICQGDQGQGKGSTFDWVRIPFQVA